MFIVFNAYIREKQRSAICNLCLHHRKLEREEQFKPKASIRKEIIKIRIEVNETGDSKITEKIK